MTRREPALGPELPGAAPSPDVLDELLRAFAVDIDDHDRLAAVDLTSPEVDALLTPPGTVVPTPSGDDDDGAANDVDGDAEPGADALGDAAPPEPTDPSLDARAGSEVEPPDDVRVSPDGAIAGDPLLGAVTDASADDGDETAGATVSIIDDDLPDAVYVGGSLEPAAPARPTVFIDGGEEATDSSTMSIEDASSAAHIEPRLRDRRIAVKRAAGRKRLKWALAITLVLMLVIAALAVLGSGLFSIDEVRVEGAVRTDESALEEIVDDLEGRPVLRVDTGVYEQRLKTLPWVDDARVTTDFPNGATIELRERTAVATVSDRDGLWHTLDADGRVLVASEEQPEGLTVITVDDLAPVEVAKFAPQGVGAAATLIRALTPLIESRTEAVIVTPDGSDLRLTLTGGTEVRFGAADDIVAKLVRLQTMLTDLGARPVSYIDVSTNDIGTG